MCNFKHKFGLFCWDVRLVFVLYSLKSMKVSDPKYHHVFMVATVYLILCINYMLLYCCSTKIYMLMIRTIKERPYPNLAHLSNVLMVSYCVQPLSILMHCVVFIKHFHKTIFSETTQWILTKFNRSYP